MNRAVAAKKKAVPNAARPTTVKLPAVNLQELEIRSIVPHINVLIQVVIIQKEAILVIAHRMTAIILDVVMIEPVIQIIAIIISVTNTTAAMRKNQILTSVLSTPAIFVDKKLLMKHQGCVPTVNVLYMDVTSTRILALAIACIINKY